MTAKQFNEKLTMLVTEMLLRVPVGSKKAADLFRAASKLSILQGKR